MRNVEILQKNPVVVVVSKGLEVGEIVVTAGVRALHAGQKVRLLAAESWRRNLSEAATDVVALAA
jgi:membrane fusion protein, multidrug efflux system